MEDIRIDGVWAKVHKIYYWTKTPNKQSVIDCSRAILISKYRADEGCLNVLDVVDNLNLPKGKLTNTEVMEAIAIAFEGVYQDDHGSFDLSKSPEWLDNYKYSVLHNCSMMPMEYATTLPCNKNQFSIITIYARCTLQNIPFWLAVKDEVNLKDGEAYLHDGDEIKSEERAKPVFERRSSIFRGYDGKRELITWKGRLISLKEASELPENVYGLSEASIKTRLLRGHRDLDEALAIPKMIRKNKINQVGEDLLRRSGISDE